MSRSSKFAHMLARGLREGTVHAHRDRGYLVSGRLDTAVVLAPIKIWIPWLFRDLKRFRPDVWCLAPWMKQGADWHNGKTMCWVIPHEWYDAMSWKGKSTNHIMREGQEWLFNNVRCLINRHYTAHCEGIDTWPAEWAFWGHGGEGVREYRREQQSQRRAARVPAGRSRWRTSRDLSRALSGGAVRAVAAHQ